MKRVIAIIGLALSVLLSGAPVYAGPPNSSCQGQYCEGGGYSTSYGEPVVTKNRVYITRWVSTSGTAKTAKTNIRRAASYTGTTRANGWRPSSAIKQISPGLYTRRYTQK